MLDELRRELEFAWGESVFRWVMLFALAFSAFSVLVGVDETTHQQELLDSLLSTSMEDQDWVRALKDIRENRFVPNPIVLPTPKEEALSFSAIFDQVSSS